MGKFIRKRSNFQVSTKTFSYIVCPCKTYINCMKHYDRMSTVCYFETLLPKYNLVPTAHL